MRKQERRKAAQKSAVIYCRVSSTKQEEQGTSLESQEAAGIAEAERLGYKVGRVVREAYTGAELWDRPLLSEVRAEIREGKYQALIVYAIDRLSRRSAHLSIIVEEVERAGAELVFVTEKLDDTPEGQLMLNVRAYVAEVERQKIRERCVRGKRQRAVNGLVHNAGSELYGYRRVKERGVREIHEPEAMIVRQIYQWVLAGASIRSVIRRLNEMCIPSPSASDGNQRNFRDGRTPHWAGGSVRRILTEPAYKGEAWAQRFRSGKRWREIHSRPKEEWVKLPAHTTPIIIEPEVWAAVQEKMKANRGDETRNERRPDLLRGLVYCGVCGRKMRGDSERGKHRVYRCSSRETPFGSCGSKRIPAQTCESLVWEKVASIFERPEYVTEQLEKSRSGKGDKMRAQLQSDLEVARKEVTKADEHIRRLVSRAASADDDLWQVFNSEIAAKRLEKSRFETTIAEIESRLEAEDADAASIVSFSDYCARVRHNLEGFGFAEKRSALNALGVRVVGNAREWRLDISLPSSTAGVANTTGCS